MSIYVPGLIALIVFYLVILVIGIWAGRKTGFKAKNLKIQDVMLADRSIGVCVGIFTTTATWVGGGYINGSAEVVAMQGLVWCQAPIGYSISLLIGGLFFAEKMRTCGFTTMLDPIHWKYGDLMNCLLYLPALSGDVFWSASILNALGATLKVILDMDIIIAIIVSSAIALLYTLVGGLWSVAYTDVIQLVFLFFGLWICVPFAMSHKATSSIADDGGSAWMGSVDILSIGTYIDYGLLLIFGGLPWQVYFQRILGAKSIFVAKIMSCLAGIFCFIMAIPAVILGAVAAKTDWNQTEYGNSTIRLEDSVMTLPLVMRHLCPVVITFVGLGALSGAVMSSTDSAILSSGCMFSRNVFRVIWIRIFKKNPSETCQVWVLRVAQVLIAAMSCAVAISVKSIYCLFVLCSDFVYVILYPQILCVLYLKGSNSYGSLSGFVSGLLIRLLGGEQALELPATIYFPWYDEETKTQRFPFRTLAMLVSLFVLIGVSYITHFLFTNGVIPLKYDFYGCFQDDMAQEFDNTVTRYRRRHGIIDFPESLDYVIESQNKKDKKEMENKLSSRSEDKERREHKDSLRRRDKKEIEHEVSHRRQDKKEIEPEGSLRRQDKKETEHKGSHKRQDKKELEREGSHRRQDKNDIEQIESRRRHDEKEIEHEGSHRRQDKNDIELIESRRRHDEKEIDQESLHRRQDKNDIKLIESRRRHDEKEVEQESLHRRQDKNDIELMESRRRHDEKEIEHEGSHRRLDKNDIELMESRRRHDEKEIEHEGSHRRQDKNDIELIESRRRHDEKEIEHEGFHRRQDKNDIELMESRRRHDEKEIEHEGLHRKLDKNDIEQIESRRKHDNKEIEHEGFHRRLDKNDIELIESRRRHDEKEIEHDGSHRTQDKNSIDQKESRRIHDKKEIEHESSHRKKDKNDKEHEESQKRQDQKEIEPEGSHRRQDNNDIEQEESRRRQDKKEIDHEGSHRRQATKQKESRHAKREIELGESDKGQNKEIEHNESRKGQDKKEIEHNESRKGQENKEIEHNESRKGQDKKEIGQKESRRRQARKEIAEEEEEVEESGRIQDVTVTPEMSLNCTELRNRGDVRHFIIHV